MQIDIRRTYRDSKLVGTPVVNHHGEHLGTIADLVVDVESNRMTDAILSYGGYFYFDRKYLAVPWDELSLGFDEDQKHFVLDLDHERLRNSEGIGRSHLDFSDPEKRQELEAHYYKLRGTPAKTERRTPERTGYTAAGAPRETATAEQKREATAEHAREEAAERGFGERRFSDTTGGY